MWNDIKDGLPKEDKAYMVTVETAGKPLVLQVWYDPDFGWSMIPEVFIPGITAWAELMEPYEGK